VKTVYNEAPRYAISYTEYLVFRKISSASRHQGPQKRWYPTTSLHGVTT